MTHPDLRPLYHAPLADFVAARAALAKQLRQAGDPRAAEVRTLRKPSLSAWAVNQLFASEPDAVAALVDAGERARRAAETTTQGGDAEPLRDLLRDIRARTERLTQQAVEILTAAGGRTAAERAAEAAEEAARELATVRDRAAAAEARAEEARGRAADAEAAAERARRALVRTEEDDAR